MSVCGKRTMRVASSTRAPAAARIRRPSDVSQRMPTVPSTFSVRSWTCAFSASERTWTRVSIRRRPRQLRPRPAQRFIAGFARRGVRTAVDGPEDVVQHRAGEQRCEPGEAVPADVDAEQIEAVEAEQHRAAIDGVDVDREDHDEDRRDDHRDHSGRAERHAERPLEVRLLDAQAHGGDEDEHVGRDEEDHVDHHEVLERPDDEHRVEGGHEQDSSDGRAEAFAHDRDRPGKQPVGRDGEQRAGSRGEVVEVQGEIAEQRRGEQRDAERRAAQRLADLDERDVAVAGLGGEAVPVAVPGEARDGGQHIHDDDERHRQHESPRDHLLRVADLPGECRHGLVTRVHPDADGEAEREHPAGAEEGRVGDGDRGQRVEVPLDQADDDERDERRQDDDREEGRAKRDELHADDVHGREDRDDRPSRSSRTTAD